MKKTLSVILAALIVFSALTFAPFSVSAVTSGDYTYKILDDNTIEITKYSGNAVDLVIPKTIDGYTVTQIGKKAFYSCKGLTEIIIPDSITRIGSNAFSNCTNLEKVTLPESITLIDNGAFTYCTALTEVNIPKSISSLDNHVFSHCTSLREIYIPDTLTEIKTYAFAGCELNSIIIDENHPVYDNRENCNAIIETATNTMIYGGKYTSFPESVTTIGHAAFIFSTIEKVVVPDTIIKINGSAFSRCENLEEVILPNSLDNIPYGMFFNCTSLKKVNIPDNAKHINESAFHDCSSLETIELPDGLQIINDSAFTNCKSLKEITLPQSMQAVGWYTFLGCDNLTSMTILSTECNIYTDGLSYGIPHSMPFTTTIYAYLGSGAHGYASSTGNPFVPLNPLGDVDGDMEVSVLDATKIQMFIAESAKLSKAAQNNGNVDKDAELTVLDATTIQRLLAKLITEF